MKSFLSLVAHNLYTKKQGDLSHTVVVFPSKRAGLFFNQSLVRESNGKPLFAPTYMTLDEVFRSLTDLRPDDPIRLVCVLHRIFCQATGRDESIDSFYAWGKLMLSDFDDIDKNLVDTKALFRSVKEYRELSSPDDYLTPEQRKVLEHFFASFRALPEQGSALRDNFIRIWEVMGRIYDDFHKQLTDEGMAYEGMLCRDAIEHFDAARLKADTYVLVGFNVLSTVEQQLFDHLRDCGKALFYWDYDRYYLDDERQEAGNFIRLNLHRYGNALSETDNAYDNFSHRPAIDIVSAPSDNAQASYVHDWLRTNITDPEQETAVVLADETLLQPVLHALPTEDIREINVTMGYPMTQTAVFRWLSTLIDEAKEATQPLDMLKGLGNAIDAKGLEMKQLGHRLQEEEEALYRAHLAVNNLIRLVEDGTLTGTCRLLTMLLTNILRTTSIPFHGEPARGLQVMGVLETRNLDFRHLLFLSTDEGMLPKAPSEVSFIPFTLRKAFGLTTIERQTAVYAYYFYRMIQRAESVTLVCMNGTDGMNQRTPSRFITQLQVEYDGSITRHALQADGTLASAVEPITVEQTDETRRKLAAHFAVNTDPKGHTNTLSPTALNDYLNCPLKFYFKHIEGLTFNDENTEEVTVAQFGTIFHYSAELAYKRLTSADKHISRQSLIDLADDTIAIESIVDQAFREKYFHMEANEELPYDGIHLINRAAIIAYLRQLLRTDAERAPFEYVASEQYIHEDFVIPCHGASLTVRLGGIIDRMDSKDGVTRIVDYKTGGDEDGCKTIDELFDRNAKKRKKYVFQALYYSWFLSRAHTDVSFSPALLYARRTAATDYDPVLKLNKTPITDFRADCMQPFSEQMNALMNEIFNSDVPYTQTPNLDACRYCDFCPICGRKPKEN